jgi:hypothetical protein
MRDRASVQPADHAGERAQIIQVCVPRVNHAGDRNLRHIGGYTRVGTTRVDDAT